ncbi:T9SS inner membrane protein PorL/GldL [Maribacter sp. IgM3_T14_3]|uniref:type IX secretion system motor protein PorL/GldL n=1 Tax=Maribacter TaxID=252356 RepID=UPI00278D5174|nr:gliding motility protein GldL [Maribacter sp.]
MAQSKSTKKLFNMAYGLGASVVIIGALFKILHWELGPLNGGILLAIGLITEALIFAISAFEPVDEDLDWALVYPELAGGEGKAPKKAQAATEIKEAEASLSKKLDDLLKEAGVDASLMESLGSSIKNFEGAAKGIAPTVDAMESTKKYSSEMVHAAAQMESLNSLYKVQLESASKQASVNEEVVQNASALKDQMASLSTNLSSLNGVYGGMLSAMSSKN